MTDSDLSQALSDLARTLKHVDERLRDVELATAEAKGLQAGLALNRRLREHESLQRAREDSVDEQLAARAPRDEMQLSIASAIDSALRKWAIRVFAALVTAAPIWITVSITIANWIEGR